MPPELVEKGCPQETYQRPVACVPWHGGEGGSLGFGGGLITTSGMLATVQRLKASSKSSLTILSVGHSLRVAPPPSLTHAQSFLVICLKVDTANHHWLQCTKIKQIPIRSDKKTKRSPKLRTCGGVAEFDTAYEDGEEDTANNSLAVSHEPFALAFEEGDEPRHLRLVCII